LCFNFLPGLPGAIQPDESVAEVRVSTNLQLLESAGIINANNLPDAGDMATINNLNQNDVNGLINVFNALGGFGTFLVNNCNPGGTVAPGGTPGPGVRTIGIVF
jgi:hypothetical protein